MSTCTDVGSFIESKTSVVQTSNVGFTSEVSDYLLVHTGPEEIIKEEQTDFTAGRSTTGQNFNLRILFEKYLQHQQNLHYVFVDFKRRSTEFGMQLCGQP